MISMVCRCKYAILIEGDESLEPNFKPPTSIPQPTFQPNPSFNQPVPQPSSYAPHPQFIYRSTSYNDFGSFARYGPQRPRQPGPDIYTGFSYVFQPFPPQPTPGPSYPTTAAPSFFSGYATPPPYYPSHPPPVPQPMPPCLTPTPPPIFFVPPLASPPLRFASRPSSPPVRYGPSPPIPMFPLPAPPPMQYATPVQAEQEYFPPSWVPAPPLEPENRPSPAPHTRLRRQESSFDSRPKVTREKTSKETRPRDPVERPRNIVRDFVRKLF